MGGCEMAQRQNPYMSNQPQRRGAHFSMQPLATVQPVRRRRRRWPWVLLLLVALGVGGYVGWQRFGDKISGLPLVGTMVDDITDRLGIGGKKVTITLDGAEARVAEGSTVQDVFEATHPEVMAGNLVSVNGGVLQEGQGELFSATLDEQPLAYADAATTVVAEGASLTFSDGANVTEDFTSEWETVSTPRMVRQVKAGTRDAGYAVQQGTLQYVYQWGKEGRVERRYGQVSGEVADGQVVEGQDCIIMCQDVNPDNGEKLVALTFDDGPTYYTEQYMAILSRYGVKATFNLIGEQVEDYASVCAANAAAGNQITSHTWHHPDLTTLGEEDLRAQLVDTFNVLRDAAGVDTTTIRAPYGDIDINVWLRSGGCMTLSVFWTHDSLDWKVPGVDQIVANCTSNMAPGSVILMHDGGGNRDQDLDALPQIIEAWQNAGYRFVTVEELMASDSSIPAECTANYRPMPEDAVWPTELAEAATVVE